MKKAFLSIAISLVAATSFAQWTETGNNKTSGYLSLGSASENGYGKRHLTLLSSSSSSSSTGSEINLHYNFNNSLSSFIQSIVPNGNSTDLLFYTSQTPGAHTPKMRIKGNGNIGIGMDAPLYKLDVNGDIRANSLYLKTTETKNGWNSSRIYYPGHSLIIGSPEGTYSHNSLEIKPGGSTIGAISSYLSMYIAPTMGIQERKVLIQTDGNSYFNGGYVGIGTDAPKHELDVRGVISAEEVKVQILRGANHVFNTDYDLKPLSEVESFIKENRHLSEIPSEKQMRENGLNMNEFQIKLLQKIEELTLYVIDQDKTIKEQGALLQKQNNFMESLHKSLIDK